MDHHPHHHPFGCAAHWRRRLLRSRALVLIHEQSGAARGPELCIASPRKQLGSRSTPPGLSKPHA